MRAWHVVGAIVNISKALADFVGATNSVKTGITSPFSMDADSLTALNALFNLNVSIASNIKNLSLNLNILATSAHLIDYSVMLSAMLRLSTDIGTMASLIVNYGL